MPLYILIFLSIFAFACSKPTSSLTDSQNKAIEPAPSLSQYNDEASKILQEQLIAEGRFQEPDIQIDLEEIQVSPEYKAEELDFAFKYRHARYHQCYANALAKDAALGEVKGKIQLRLQIDAQGQQSLAAFESSFESTELNDCLRANSELWSIRRSSPLPEASLSFSITFSVKKTENTTN